MDSFNFTNPSRSSNLSPGNPITLLTKPASLLYFSNDKFLVFSDDVEWCLEKFKDNPNVQIMDKGDEVEDFNLFSSTKHQIIANSSWSWWGAYLCPNNGHKVIAPSKEHWYRDGVERTVCPQEWIRI